MTGDMGGVYVVLLVLVALGLGVLLAFALTTVGGLLAGFALRKRPVLGVLTCAVGAPSALGLVVALFSTPELGWIAGGIALVPCAVAAVFVGIAAHLSKKKTWIPTC